MAPLRWFMFAQLGELEVERKRKEGNKTQRQGKLEQMPFAPSESAARNCDDRFSWSEETLKVCRSCATNANRGGHNFLHVQRKSEKKTRRYCSLSAASKLELAPQPLRRDETLLSHRLEEAGASATMNGHVRLTSVHRSATSAQRGLALPVTSVVSFTQRQMESLLASRRG